MANMAEGNKPDFTAIEADLKRMLNINQSGKSDLQGNKEHTGTNMLDSVEEQGKKEKRTINKAGKFDDCRKKDKYDVETDRKRSEGERKKEQTVEKQPGKSDEQGIKDNAVIKKAVHGHKEKGAIDQPVSLNRQGNKNRSQMEKADGQGKNQEKQSSGTVVTLEDLENVTKKWPSKAKPPLKQPDKDSASGLAVVTSAVQGSATDPLSPEAGKKKKKKKAKKKKIKSEFLEKKKITNENISDSDDSDVEPVENQSDPEKPKYNIDLIRTKYLDTTLTPAVLNELEYERIFPLKKKSTKFPKAMYFCRLCDYHCDSVALSQQHSQDARHKRRKEIRQQDQMLKNLPHPSSRHLEALDKLIDDVFTTRGLSSEDLVHRHKVALDIEEFIIRHIPEIRVRVYGSSLTGFGLKDAGLDMDLVYPEEANPANCLARVYKLLVSSEEFTNVKSNFSDKVPAVLFTSPCKTLHCRITVGSRSAYLTSRYLTIYRELDERCMKLAVVFKYWAKVCKLDQQDQGTLPAYCYSLMTVFFLQHCQPPVLPILWKDLSEQALKRPKTHHDEDQMLSELKHQPWVSENTQSAGELWREMIIFYGLHFDLNEKVICVRSKDVLHRSEKRWKSRRIAIEDPFSPKRNAGRSMHHTRLFDYFYNCLRKACLYFSLPTSHQNMSQYYNDKRHTSHKQKDAERKAEDQSGTEKESDHLPKVTHKQHGENECKKERVHDNVATKHDSEAEKDTEAMDRDNGGINVVTDEEINIEELAEETSFSRFLTSIGCDSIQNLHQLTANRDDNLDNKETVNEISGVDHVENEKNSESHETTEDIAECEEDNTRTLDTEDSSDSGIPENHFFVACKLGLVKNSSDLESSFSESEKVETVATRIAESVSIVTDKMDDMKLEVISEVKNDSGVSAKKDDSAVTESKLANLGNKKQLDIQSAKTNLCEPENGNKTVIKGNSAASEAKDNKAAEEAKAKEVEMKGKSLHDSSCDSDSDSLLETSDSSPQRRQPKRVSSPVGAEYSYQFALNTLTDGKGPSILCPICDKEGHLKATCPEDQLPKVIDIAPPTMAHLRLLTSVVMQCMKDFSLTPEEIYDREGIRRGLEIYIQELFPDAKFELFGSSMNGFGFHQSDLDICVTFNGKKPEELNFIEYIEAICKKLKTHKGLYGVFPITTAKVPIVKFKHRRSNLEGDISLYNILAIENTRLLCTYARMDPRVQTLGYAIKVFARVCDIGDASRGSLSSYAYMLMMIHYLQHTKPPVIPILQELRLPGNPDPQFMVEGWNAWFIDDMSKLNTVWPHFGKNGASVGALWEGFFRYFLEEFSFDDQVVTIRQIERLTKFEKLWNGKCLAIEDPFDLNHNLGGGLSQKMNHYILSTLVRARELYSISVVDDTESLTNADMLYYQDYFFDKQKLVTGDPPSDRLCRVCSKIGHIAKECPRILARKEREAQERKRREEQREEKGQPATQATPEKPNHNRQGTARSLSDPGDKSAPTSPYRGHDQGQMGGQGQHRGQHPHSLSQSPDNRGKSPRLNINKAERHYQDGGSLSPSHSGNQSPRWLNQSQQSNYREAQGHGYAPNEPYHMGNQNGNSAYRRQPHQYRQQGYGGYGSPMNANQSRYDQRPHGDMVYVNQSRQHTQSGYRNQPAVSPGHHHGNVPVSPHGYHHGNNPPSSPGNQHGNQFYEGSPQGQRSDRQVNYPKKGKKQGKAVDIGVTVTNEYYKKKEDASQD